MLIRSSSVIAVCCAATASFAETPAVVTDMTPMTALANSVMHGVAEADQLLPAGASPHDYNMRPSDAQKLATADIVLWVGHGLTPWLETPIESLAPNALSIEMLDSADWPVLETRTSSSIWISDAEDDHDHDDHSEHDDHAEHDDHDNHEDHGHEDHDEHAEHEDHGDHDDHDHHDHGPNDPHAWLSPDVMAAWANTVATELSAYDPANAAIYQANAALAATELEALHVELSALLADVPDHSYVVAHDAFQYFEVAFGVPAAGTIALSDAAEPGANHIAELRELMDDAHITCILTDTQTNPQWATIIAEGTDASLAIVDPALSGNTPDLAGYAANMRDIAQTLADCVAD